MRKTHLILLASILAACSSDPTEPVKRPGMNGEEQVEDNLFDEGIEVDYAKIIGDKELRFVSDTLSMRYDEGGILYIVDAPEYKFINMTTGEYITFNAADSTLKVNGIGARIKAMEQIGSEGAMRWYVFYPSAEVIVVEQ